MMFLRNCLRSERRRTTLSGTLMIALCVFAQQQASAVTCSITPSSNPLAFGSYNTTNSVSVNSFYVQINCSGWGGTNSVSYTLTASAGSGSFSGRQMSSGGHVINYNLYTNSSDTTIFGDGTSGTVTITGTVTNKTNPANVSIFGLIPGGQNVPPGSYATTTAITVTLNYTAQ